MQTALDSNTRQALIEAARDLSLAAERAVDRVLGEIDTQQCGCGDELEQCLRTYDILSDAILRLSRIR